MKRRLDSIIIGGAMLFGGIAHRRADHVAKQVDELEEAIEAVEDQLRDAGSRAERPAIPGMPLPTGYGLQVRGPDNENIILPVCLPPGFELDSMVLCPEFLPRDQPQPARVAAAPAPAPLAPVAAAPAPAPALLAEAPGERFSGTLQYVFGTGEPGFSMDETFGGAVEADAPPARRSLGIETHHLA
jgi:hypothetical protein